MAGRFILAALGMAAALSAGGPAVAAPAAGTLEVTTGHYGPYGAPHDPYYRGPPGLAVQIQPQQPLTLSAGCRIKVVRVVNPHTGVVGYEKRKICPAPRY